MLKTNEAHFGVQLIQYSTELLVEKELLYQEDTIVENGLIQNVKEVRRLAVPLRILVRELWWEKEHCNLKGTGSPEAFEILGQIWNVLKECSRLFQEDESFDNEIGNNQLAQGIKELRQNVTRQLNMTHKLLTSPLGEDKIPERIDKAHKIASKTCEEDVPKLIEEMGAFGECLKRTKT